MFAQNLDSFVEIFILLSKSIEVLGHNFAFIKFPNIVIIYVERLREWLSAKDFRFRGKKWCNLVHCTFE